ITSVMSTSLKVVSIAAVFWASLRRRAIVWRSFVIRTRSSRALSSGVVARGGGTGAGTGAGAMTGAGAGAVAAAAAASTSPLSTWPRLPLPATPARSILLSAASLAAEGAGGIGAAGAGAAFGGAAGGGAAAGAAAPPDNWPSSAPIATVWPVSAVISLSTPAPGALTSSVTLSVSSSTRGSSARTGSPAFLNHLPTVASLIDSPRVGTRISIAMLVAPRGALLHSGSYGGDRGERHARPNRDGRHREILVDEAALGQDRRIGGLHRLERRQRRRLDDRDAVGAGGIGDRPHRDHRPDLDPRHPVLAMATHHHGLLARHVHEKRRPRRLQLAKIVRHGSVSSRLASGQAFVEKGLELSEVLRHQAGRGRRCGRTTGVTRSARLASDLAEHPLDIGFDEEPRAHVLRLLLAPHDLRLFEAGQVPHQPLQREWVKLLDTQEIDVVDAPLLALVVEIPVDLAGRDDDSPDLVVADELDLLVLARLGVVEQDAVERRARAEAIQRRHGALVAQHRLRRHRDQRLAERPLQLAAQHVEEIGRRRAVDDLQVVLGAELQIALEPGRRVLRPLSLVAVRQQAYEARHAQPLAFAGRNELVEHDLRAVGEVAELRLPHDERVRLGQRIAVFEPEHRLFRQHRVDDLVPRLAVADVVERDVARLGVLVDQHRMALRERAPFAVLAREPNRKAFVEQRGEGERLGGRPVDALSARDRVPAIFEEAQNRLVDVEGFGRRGDSGADLLQPLDADAGLAAAVVVDDVLLGLDAGPASVEPIGLVRQIGLARLIFGLEPVTPVGPHLVDLALGDDAFRDQLLGVDLQARRMRADQPVHDRLGERWLVALVVAEPPIAEDVDDHGLVELLPVLGRDLGAEDDRLRVVAVDVEDRRLDQLGDVGGVGRGARIARVSGEPDLVVDDEMKRAAGAMAAQAREAEAFRHDPLAGEGRVAVDQQRQHFRSLDEVVELVLLGARLAEHDGVDDL